MIVLINNQVLLLRSDGDHEGCINICHHERTGGARRGRRTLHHAVIAKVGDDVVSSSINGRVMRPGQLRERRPTRPRACHSGAVVGVSDEGTPLHTMVPGVSDDQESVCINGGCSGILQLCRT